MFELPVRWTTPLFDPLSCAPAALRDLTVIRQSQILQAYDGTGRRVWTREIAPAPVEGQIASNDECIVTTSTIEVTDDFGRVVSSKTRFDIFDEGAELLGSATTPGTLRQGGLAVRGEAVHAWMNDGGMAFRRMHLDDDLAFNEVLVPLAQPWDRNVTKRGVVLIGYCGRRDGAHIWDPRTQKITALIRDVDVWSHGIHGDTLILSFGPHEADVTLVAFNLKTRQEIWRRSDTTHGVAVTEHGVLAYLGRQDRIPALLDLDTGDINWMAPTPHAGFTWSVAGPLAFARGSNTVVYHLVSGKYLGEGELGAVLPFEDHFVAVVGDRLVAYEYLEVSADVGPPAVTPRPRGLRSGRFPTPGWQETMAPVTRRA